MRNDSIAVGKVTERSVINRYQDTIQGIHSRLFQTLEPFEIRHRLITRFILINEEVPKTPKGNISQSKIKAQFGELIQHLTDPLTPDAAVKDVHQMMDLANTYTREHNPYIGNLLAAARLDFSYHRGLKDSLFTYSDGKEKEILDLVGGYGLNLLGHNHPTIQKSIIGFIQSQKVALADQGSIQQNVSLLAEELGLTIGEKTGDSYYTLFGSTGSEAVEVALHHALFDWWKQLERIKKQQFQQFGKEAGELLKEVWEYNERQIRETRVKVLALKNAYHGHSSGARSLMGNLKNRENFINLLGLDPIFLDDLADNQKEILNGLVKQENKQLKRVAFHDQSFCAEPFEYSTIIAAIAEPVLGEGGVRIIDKKFLRELGSFHFPLILDEIQCGLGRTGSFLASEGIRADYYLFAKALGGGFEKISAILINKSRFQTDFSQYYNSTFSNGGLAAHVALETLKLIKGDQITERVRNQGNKLMDGLSRIQAKHPDCIKKITGSGLMLGINLNISTHLGIILRVLQDHDLLGYTCASYLLNKHSIRILPTVSKPNILRLEPSAYITDEEIQHVLSAIQDLAHVLSSQKVYELLKPLMENDPFTDGKGKTNSNGHFQSIIEKPAENAVQVALIAHFAYPTEELRMFDPDLCQASDTGLRILFNRMQILMDMKPLLLFSKNIFRNRIHFKFYVLPLDVAELEKQNRQNQKQKIIAKIQQTINLAEEKGASVISLGGYTSILTSDGQRITAPRSARIVTGNTLTAASGIKNLIKNIEDRFQPGQERNLAIVGASGNIGSVITEWLFHSESHFDTIYLFGRNHSRLEMIRQDIESNKQETPKCPLIISTDLMDLKKCNIIIAAANTNDPIIFKHHLDPFRPIIISDLSIPGAISKEVKKLPQVIDLPFAAFIALPEDPDFVLSSFTPKGSVFCCAAEAILCGLETIQHNLIGKISIQAIDEMIDQAGKYHFFDRFIPAQSYKETMNT